ncbi:MAG: HD domain-containing protein [Ktedonobacterales bacterium]
MYQPSHMAEELEGFSTFADHSAADSSILQRTYIENAAVNTQIIGDALILRADLRTDRSNRPYIAMTLQCAGGATIEARWWHFPFSSGDCPAQGVVYRITAYVDAFNGERQLRITSAQQVPTVNLSAFFKTTRRSAADLRLELSDVCASLDDQMRTLVQEVLSNQILNDFCDWPAANRYHGAVRHGLLAHSLRVAELVQRMAEAYGIDGLEYDRSLTVTAALLHDIGKLRTLPAVAGAAIPEDASLYDHVTLSLLAVQHAANLLDNPVPSERLDKLLHAILAHHGRQEWGAAHEPHTVEAWLVHLADLVESRLWAFSNEEAESPGSPSELAKTGVGPIQDDSIADTLLM